MTTPLITISPWRNHPIAHSFEYLLDGPLKDIDCIIAGGSVRNLFLEEPMGKSDIDIWFHTDANMMAAVEIFKNLKHPNAYWKPENKFQSEFMESFVQVANTVNGYTFVHRGYEQRKGLPYQMRVQLLRKREAAPTTLGILELFDFTICQFAYKRGLIYVTPEALMDHTNGVLRRNPKCTGVVSYDRAVKYMGKGYTPTRSFFDKMFLEERTAMLPGDIELSNVFYEDGFKSNV
jgi:hypothetical protein